MLTFGLRDGYCSATVNGVQRMNNYHIYFTGQLAGPPLATIPATSASEAITTYQRELPYAVRADRLAATTKLRDAR